MDDRMAIEAVAAARQLLQNFKVARPDWENDKTPVDELVSWHGLEVTTFDPGDQPEGTYGWLEPGEDLIWLRRDLPETLRRFTLAHELGHAVLHRSPATREQPVPESCADDPCQGVDVQEAATGLIDQEQIEEILGTGQAYDPRSQRELAANIFAAELLMPFERVQTLYLEQQVLPHQLASTFGVSTLAMLNCLARLLNQSLTPAIAGSQDGSLQEAHLQEEHHPAPRRQYDEFQQAAIEAATPALIVAGPGSGKTSTLIGRAEYLIRTLDMPAQHILALTFSRKAAQEMQERLQQALQGTPAYHTPPTVSTFHAFCAELLRSQGERVGLRPDFSLIDEVEGYFLLRRLAGELPLQHYQHLRLPTFYFPDLLQAISRAKDELVTPEQYQYLAQRMLEQARNDEEVQAAEKALEVAAIYARYEAALRRRGDTDFGGLIMLTTQLLQEHPDVLHEQQQHYQHILVDEFQDMNRASGILLRLLAGEEQRVWVVGDANQAIYSFRGASPANIANFQSEYDGATVLPLNRNYRSRPDIVSLADMFRLQRMEPGTEQVTRQVARSTQPDSYVTLATGADEASELAGLIADMRYKRAQNGYSYRDMVVLCRTRAQARKVAQALALAGLPVIGRGGGNMLEQEYMRNVLSIVLLLTEPSGMGILRAARRSEHAFTQSDIEALLLAAREQACSPGSLIAHAEAPEHMSSAGRRSLLRLADILQVLSRMPDVWSLLVQYLFIETSIVRDLLCAEERDQAPITGQPPTPGRPLWSPLPYSDGLAPAVDSSGGGTPYSDGLAPAVDSSGGGTPFTGQPPTPGRPQGSPLPYSDGLAPAVDSSGRARDVLADYAKLLDLARYYDRRQQREEEQAQSTAGVVERAQGFLEYLKVIAVLRQDSGNRREGTGSNAEDAPDGIRVMTVHASKGLEFPVVYLPGLAQRRFPMQARSSSVSAPQGMLSTVGDGQLARDINESGEACLFYVGMTRARDYLVLSHSERYGKQNYKPSAYLDMLAMGLPADRLARVYWQGDAATVTEEQEQGNAAASFQPSEGFIQAMESRVLSVSSVETYQICPRRYAYGHIYRFRHEEDAYQLFWQATRKTLEALQVSLADASREHDAANPGARFPTQQEAGELYMQHWQTLGGHESPFASIYEQHGREIVDLLWSMLAGEQQMTWELQRSFEVEVAGRVIRVEVDRIETSTQASKPVRFVRTRTGKSKGKAVAEVRELLYAHAYRQRHPGRGIEVHHHNLSTGEMLSIKLTEKREQKLLAELVQTIEGLEQHVYPATPDSFVCPNCPFFLICPA